jgi:phosphate transport system permease protein
VLSLSRALGEAAPLILAGAVLGSYSSGGADLVGQLVGPYTALPIVVYRWTTLPQEEFRQLAAAGMIVLLVITFAANGLAIYLRNRYSRSW